MKIGLFLTTDLGAALELLARVRREAPDAQLAVFVKDDHRDDLAWALHGCEVRRDKPLGGKLAFVRALRRERFDRLIVAWHGGERFQPLRLVALWCGAREVVAIDEHGQERVVRWYAPQTWVAHAVRRLQRARAATLLRLAARAYRLTIGVVVASVLLLPTGLGLWLGGRWRRP